LFGAQRGNAIADMLATDLDRITTPQAGGTAVTAPYRTTTAWARRRPYAPHTSELAAGVEQYIAPHPLLGADRPALVIGSGIFLRPYRKAGAFLPLRILDADGRIDGDVIGLFRPPE